jgi:putative pyruvate formate lyase activating enzyme
MGNIKKALPRYLGILEGKEKPKFQLNKSKLGRKAEEAFSVLKRCELCERKCHANRQGSKAGFCKIGDKMEISSYFEHYGEEYFFVPSFTIFFMSCTFSCQFCQNWTISQRFEKGSIMEEKELAKIIEKHAYCRNVNFVGGEPTPHLPFILGALKHVKVDVPVVWNSNFYMSEKSMMLLRGVVDVYLSDFKYGNDECAKRLSKVGNYVSIIKRNHLLAFEDSEMVIRHLVMPNHIECCTKPVLEFASDSFKDRVIVNIMDQYRPQYNAFKYNDINREVSKEEFEEAVRHAKKLRLNFIT